MIMDRLWLYPYLLWVPGPPIQQVFQDSGVVYLLDEALAGYAVGASQGGGWKKCGEIYGKSMGNL